MGLLPEAILGWFVFCGIRLGHGGASAVAVVRAWGDAPELEGTTTDGIAMGVFAFLTSPVLVFPWTLRKRMGVDKARFAKPTFVCGGPTIEGGRPSKMSTLGSGVCVGAV